MRADKKKCMFARIFLPKNLVGKKKSTNFALGFGNEAHEVTPGARKNEHNASLAQLARARDL